MLNTHCRCGTYFNTSVHNHSPNSTTPGPDRSHAGLIPQRLPSISYSTSATIDLVAPGRAASDLPANAVPNLLQLFSLCSCRPVRSNSVQYQARQAGGKMDKNVFFCNANKYSCPQSSHLTRAKPKCKSPQSLRGVGSVGSTSRRPNSVG